MGVYKKTFNLDIHLICYSESSLKWVCISFCAQFAIKKQFVNSWRDIAVHSHILNIINAILYQV